MIGRGIFGNPALFTDPPLMDHHERLQLLHKHLTRFAEEWEEEKNFAILIRFFKIYVHSFDQASTIREKLMNTNSYRGAMRVLEEFELTLA